MRFQHYAIRTEKAYTQWIKRFLVFHRRKDRAGPERGWRHPKTMGTAEVAAFLTHLAVSSERVSSHVLHVLHTRSLPTLLPLLVRHATDYEASVASRFFVRIAPSKHRPQLRMLLKMHSQWSHQKRKPRGWSEASLLSCAGAWYDYPTFGSARTLRPTT